MASRKEQKDQLRAERLAHEADEQARERRRRLVQYGSGAAFLAICIVAVLIIVSQSGDGGGSSGEVSQQQISQVQEELQGIPQHGTVLGDPRAKVTVTEFGDLQCPVCKEFAAQVTPGLISGVVRKGTANYDFRQWTIIGPQSTDAAKAALAAGEQGRYWNFIDLFYLNQGTENSGYVTDDFLTSIAEGAGVPDMAKWDQDRKSSKWDSVLSQTQTEAQGLGFTGTPSVLVEGPGGKKAVGGGAVPTLAQIESAVNAVE
jgi:protein-disulfide isomerase